MNFFSHIFFTSYCFENDKILKETCILPDKDENDYGYSSHFFNPVTYKCYLNSEDSAKNRFIWHISNYLIKNNKESLGRAIHFLEDICTPVHTQYEDPVDAALKLNLHINFEKQLDEYLESHIEFKQYIMFNTISELLKYCPCKSAELYQQYVNETKLDNILKNVSELTISALYSLKNILESKKIIAKQFSLKNIKINVLFEKNNMLPSCLDSNFCLRYNGFDNILAFSRSNRFHNFQFTDFLLC